MPLSDTWTWRWKSILRLSLRLLYKSTSLTQHVYWQFANNANSAVSQHWYRPTLPSLYHPRWPTQLDSTRPVNEPDLCPTLWRGDVKPYSTQLSSFSGTSFPIHFVSLTLHISPHSPSPVSPFVTASVFTLSLLFSTVQRSFFTQGLPSWSWTRMQTGLTECRFVFLVLSVTLLFLASTSAKHCILISYYELNA